MKKAVGCLLLSFWIPILFAVAFPNISEGMYTIGGFIMMIFGTWAGIILVKD